MLNFFSDEVTIVVFFKVACVLKYKYFAAFLTSIVIQGMNGSVCVCGWGDYNISIMTAEFPASFVYALWA